MLISDVLFLEQQFLIYIFLSMIFEDLMGGTMKITTFWAGMLCRFVQILFLLTYSSYFLTSKLKIHGTFLQNIRKFLPDYMLSYPTRQYS
jgi:hypothetical protein